MLSILGLASVAHAIPVTWTLSNVFFSNDGPSGVTATGSFKYDADTNTFSDISITTTQGSFTDAVTYTRACTAPGCSSVSSATEILFISDDFSADMSGDQHMRVGLLAPMTNAMGTLPVQFVLHLKCNTPGCGFGGSGQRNADPGATIIGSAAVVPPGPGTISNVPTLNDYALMALVSLMAMLGIAAFKRKRD